MWSTGRRTATAGVYEEDIAAGDLAGVYTTPGAHAGHHTRTAAHSRGHQRAGRDAQTVAVERAVGTGGIYIRFVAAEYNVAKPQPPDGGLYRLSSSAWGGP